jgi:hypothetical protein
MAEYREVVHQRLYLREPNTERLRKSSAGRLRYLLATGWKETERWHAPEYITVKMERSGVAPRMTQMPKIAPPPPRPPRSQRFGQGPGGGGGPRGPGGGGAPRGPGGGGGPRR